MSIRIYSNTGVVVATNSVPVASGGTMSGRAYTLDFGSAPPRHDLDFTITNASVTPSSKIAVAVDYTDSEWDEAVFTVTPGSGSFVLNCELIPGPGMGNRKIEYQVT